MQAEAEVLEPVASVEFVSLDQFQKMFAGTFFVLGLLWKLKSLPITDDEMPAANEASRALYELAIEQDASGAYVNEWLHPLVTKGSKWTALAMSFGPLLLIKYQSVTAEVATRRRGNTSTDARASQSAERDPEPTDGKIVG